MQIKLYKNFSKRINSTKQPASDAGTEVTVYLKEGTSIENPTFVINGIDTDYNYASAFGHYYFIRDLIITNNNNFEIVCEQDVLATYKSAIGSYSAFVEYSQSSYNKWLADQRLTMSNDVEWGISQVSFLQQQSGSYVLTVAGKDSSGNAKVGFTCSYAVNAGNIEVLMNKLYSDDLLADLDKFFNDPFSSIVEAHWIPWDIAGGGDFIYLGSQSSGAQGNGLASETLASPTTVSILIPWKHNDWRDFAPYTSIKLYLPYYGVVDIDPANYIKEGTQVDSVKVDYALDPITGEIVYYVYGGVVETVYRANAGVPLSIGQTSRNTIAGISETISGAIGTIGGIASGNGVLVASGISNIVSGGMTAFSQTSSAKGTNGSFAMGNLANNKRAGDFYLTLQTHKFSCAPADVNSNEGRPLFAKTQISNLSGYVKCASASVSISGLASDRDAINNFLNGGFYYE